MNLSELHPSGITFWVTVMLLGITVWYLWLLMLPLNHSKKMREVELIRKKLIRFYIPLQNSLSIMEEEEHIGQSYIIAKATALNNAVKKVLNYENLSSSELRPLIRRFQYIDYPANFAMDAGKAYDEVVDSLNRIEALITRDIIEYNTKLDKLTHQIL